MGHSGSSSDHELMEFQLKRRKRNVGMHLCVLISKWQTLENSLNSGT